MIGYNLVVPLVTEVSLPSKMQYSMMEMLLPQSLSAELVNLIILNLFDPGHFIGIGDDVRDRRIHLVNLLRDILQLNVYALDLVFNIVVIARLDALHVVLHLGLHVL